MARDSTPITSRSYFPVAKRAGIESPLPVVTMCVFTFVALKTGDSFSSPPWASASR